MRIRQHVNPLKSDLLDIADVPRVDAPRRAALEVELGAAEAHFLIDRARHEPRRRRSSASRSGASWSTRSTPPARRRARPTCAACSRTCRSTWPRLFADGSVRRFFLNFPDPWFKSRQHKRRVIGPGADGGDRRARWRPAASSTSRPTSSSSRSTRWPRWRRESPDAASSTPRAPWTLPAREPLRREVAARAPVRERGRPDLAAALPAGPSPSPSALAGRADRSSASPSRGGSLPAP